MAEGGIFVTVGGQTPFDRLVRTVDGWAASHGRRDVFAQIGETTRYPEHVEWSHFLSPGDFEARVRAAELVVAHAGTGTLMVCLEAGTPVIMLPRLASRGETRNEHQSATLSRFGGREGVHAAADEEELVRLLDRAEELTEGAGPPGRVSEELLETIRRFIAE
jgi:UDP-N-acetylglucosamine transferase subunit ALG13